MSSLYSHEPLGRGSEMSAWLRPAENSAKSADVRIERERETEANGRTKVETTNCRGFGSLCPRWMRRKKLEKEAPC